MHRKRRNKQKLIKKRIGKSECVEDNKKKKMPRSRFAGSLISPKVAATKAVAEETYGMVTRGSVSSHNFEKSLKKMCKEGAYWGTVAGVYAGMEYGAERIRGTNDWKNAMIGGALTGALISAASNNNRDKIVMDAITGGAVATASEFLNYLT
ncbi:outer envelope pore protein 16, chloroplastic isoform X2 [Solanum stenotomum]|uniref:outer envelope pore protein 16, chloroplastic isoform X2 n=1 Tax=Solanum stenotomum TaxID=172797 RepID=UPI0020D1D548|nr:outer envelope pore protein 16, chloroplastic isoform X2 [Solanum stenotomum]